MLGADIEVTVDGTAQEVLEAHRLRLKDAADLGFAVSQEEVPVETGTLKQSGFPPEFRGEDIVFGYTAGHADDMEYGTEQHRPPVEPLVRWAEPIGKDPGFGVWVATEKIPEDGINAQPYLRPAADRMGPFLDNRGLDL